MPDLEEGKTETLLPDEKAVMPAAEVEMAAKSREAQSTASEAIQEGEGENADDEFDKERALETIRKQRENEKRLSKELKEAQVRLKALVDAENQRQEAEKQEQDAAISELQKAQERAAELEKSLKEAQEAAQALRLRQAFSATARKIELKLASLQAEEDAFLLADLDGVEIDAEGKVTGLEDAVKELQKSRPYLFTPSDDGDGQGTPKRGKNGTQGKLNQEALTGPLVRF